MVEDQVFLCAQTPSVAGIHPGQIYPPIFWQMKTLFENEKYKIIQNDKYAWVTLSIILTRMRLVYLLSRVAKCQRYGRYECVKMLEGWGKKVKETTHFCKMM